MNILCLLNHKCAVNVNTGIRPAVAQRQSRTGYLRRHRKGEHLIVIDFVDADAIRLHRDKAII